MALPIHPFPARMAPEVALGHVAALPPGSLVLDPMAGSGTVLRVASDAGHRAVGFDLDPLAVLMAKVWTTRLDPTALRERAATVVARATASADVDLPWIDEDPETAAFVDYWFAEPQQGDLRRLAAALLAEGDPVGDALRVGLSRIVVTKDHGASLARDVSHSRPHRVFRENVFPVFPEFRRSVDRLACRLGDEPPRGGATVDVGDARALGAIADRSVDAVITSPPYLNAIDYLRGHRLSLVWLGHRVGDLRRVRAGSIGAERGPDRTPGGTPLGTGSGDSREGMDALARSLGEVEGLPPAERRMVDRYLLDLHAMVSELARVVRAGGTAVLVVGNSCIGGVFLKNARALRVVAGHLGFELVAERERELPPNRRYLPPPRALHQSDVEKRMRTETVLSFRRG